MGTLPKESPLQSRRVTDLSQVLAAAAAAPGSEVWVIAAHAELRQLQHFGGLGVAGGYVADRPQAARRAALENLASAPP